MTEIHSIHVGRPRTITDENGTWRSAIFRTPVEEAEVTARGLAGDEVADKKNHGTPDQAICCHTLDHYAYWNELYGLDGGRALGPGSVGENLTLTGIEEGEVCVGDVYSAGTARVQVSGPRVPCRKQDRKLGLAGFQERTLESLRTGFYARVLEPGAVSVGDGWRLEDRPRPRLTQRAVNACAHHDFDPGLARELLETPELAEGWKKILRFMLSRRQQ